MMRRNGRSRILAGILSAAMVLSSVNVPAMRVAAEEVGSDAAWEELVELPAAEDAAVEEADVPEGVEADAPADEPADELLIEEEAADDALMEAGEEAPEIDGLFEDAAEDTVQEDAAEEAPFAQSSVIDGVRITVQADAGVFPAAAALRAERVDAATEESVEANVETLRDEEKQVAVSYTFDIKVVDAVGEEIKPDTTRGEVKVSFATEEVQSENSTLSRRQMTAESRSRSW